MRDDADPWTEGVLLSGFLSLKATFLLLVVSLSVELSFEIFDTLLGQLRGRKECDYMTSDYGGLKSVSK